MKYAEINMLREKKITGAYKKEMDNYFSTYGEVNNFSDDHVYETHRLCSMRVMDVNNLGNPLNDIDAFIKNSEISSLMALNLIINGARMATGSKFYYNLDYPDILVEMFECFDFEKFIKKIENISPKIYELVRCEYYLLKIELNLDIEDSYKKIKKYFFDKENHNLSSYSATYTLNCIHCLALIARFNTPLEKMPSMAEKTIPLMDFFLEKKLYKYISTKLPIINFVGFLGRAFIAQRYDWMKQFMLNYLDEVDEADRELAYNYGWGVYHRAIGNYTEALSFLSKVQGGSAFMVSTARHLMIFCHYELKNYETSLSLIESYIKFLERKYEGVERPDLKEMKLFKKLLKIVSGNSLDELDDLEAEVRKLSYGGAFLIDYINKARKRNN